MKIILFICLLTIAVKGFSQDQNFPKEHDNLKYTAKDSIVTDDRNKILSLYGGATFQVDQFNVKADKIVFNQISKEVVVTGLKSYSFPYKVVFTSGVRKGTLKYKLGNDTIFIN